MTTRGGILAALLAALGRPSWWLLALAGFLVRGGIVIFLLAIVTLPSPLALANVLEPIVTPLYLGGLQPGTLALLGTGVATLIGWLVIGSGFAAVTEVALIQAAREAALAEVLEDVEPTPLDEPTPSGELAVGRPPASRVAAAHLIALIPAAFTVGIGSIQVFGVAYRELVNPTDASPIVLRVVSGAAASVIAIVVVWVLGEIIGGMAARRIVIAGESVLGAIARATLDLVRRPAGGLIAPLVTTGILVLDLAATLAVVILVWSEARSVLGATSSEPLLTGLTLVSLGAAWCLALVLTGLLDAWRSAAMTFELVRRTAAPMRRGRVGADSGSRSKGSDSGTFGASTQRRPGDWSADDRSGSL